MWMFVVFIVVVLLILVRIYQKLTLGICRSSAHLLDKVVIITGGNSGIGLETAKDLANRGAKIILACRSVRRAAAAKEEIINFTGNNNVHCVQLDLSSLRSVREFSEHILKTETRLDILINNAGAGGLGNYRTEDGLHVGMQVNYYGPFLLTCLLLPLLKSSAPSRIINVSSIIHKYGEMDFDNLNMEKYWSDYLVYANSKLYLNLMTLELSKKLRNTGVTINSLHPGVVSTNLYRNVPTVVLRKIISCSIDFMFQSAWEGAQTSIYLAVSPDVLGVSGKYFSDCREKQPSKMSLDDEVSSRLWSRTVDLVKFSSADF